MTKHLDHKDITNIVKTEMLNFTKTFIPQIEKTIVLYEKVERIETRINTLTEKLDKVRKTVSNLQPVFDAMESSVRYIKEQFDEKNSIDGVRDMVNDIISKETPKLTFEVRSAVFKDITKDQKIKDFKSCLNKIDKRINTMDNDITLFKEDINQKVDFQCGELKRLTSKDSSKNVNLNNKFKALKEEVSSSFKELAAFISDNYVSLNAYVNHMNENSESHATLRSNIDNTNTALSDKISSLCQVVKESLDNKLRQSIKDQKNENAIETKLDKINHVSLIANTYIYGKI